MIWWPSIPSRCCRWPGGPDCASENDPSSLNPEAVKIKARKALERLRPLMKSQDASLHFTRVSNHNCTGST